MPDFAAFDANLPLQSAPIESAWITGGQPVARNRVVAASTDGSAWTMLWACSPGSFRWRYSFDETIHFLEGAVTITVRDGAARRYGPGDMVFFPAGAVADWCVESDVKKLAFCQVPVPVMVRLPLKVWRRVLVSARKLAQLLQINPADPVMDEAPEQKVDAEAAPVNRLV